MDFWYVHDGPSESFDTELSHLVSLTVLILRALAMMKVTSKRHFWRPPNGFWKKNWKGAQPPAAQLFCSPHKPWEMTTQRTVQALLGQLNGTTLGILNLGDSGAAAVAICNTHVCLFVCLVGWLVGLFVFLACGRDCSYMPKISKNHIHQRNVTSKNNKTLSFPPKKSETNTYCQGSYRINRFLSGAMLLRPALRTPPGSDQPLLFPRVVFRRRPSWVFEVYLKDLAIAICIHMYCTILFSINKNKV